MFARTYHARTGSIYLSSKASFPFKAFSSQSPPTIQNWSPQRFERPLPASQSIASSLITVSHPNPLDLTRLFTPAVYQFLLPPLFPPPSRYPPSPFPPSSSLALTMMTTGASCGLRASKGGGCSLDLLGRVYHPTVLKHLQTA
eukprot:766000-Hanusia_phi.AAC.4